MDYFTDSGDYDGPDGMEKVIAVLTAGHVNTRGGYPYDYVVRDGHVFIAELDESKEYNRTLIEVYSVAALKAWEQRAREHKRQFHDASWHESVWETPDPVDTTSET